MMGHYNGYLIFEAGVFELFTSMIEQSCGISHLLLRSKDCYCSHENCANHCQCAK